MQKIASIHILLALATAGLPMSRAIAGEAVTPQEMQSDLKALSTVQKFQSSSLEGPCPTDPLENVIVPFTFGRFASSQSCSDLLSTSPPPWVTSHPDAGIFKNPSNWQPICSSFWLAKYASETHPIDRTLALTQAQSVTEGLDRCASPTSDRYVGTYKIPSQKESGVRPMSASARRQFLTQFNEEKSRLADSCCGPDQECRTLVQKIPLKFCKVQQNPKAPDPCVGIGAYFTMDKWEDRLQWIERVNQGEDISKLKDWLPMTSGSITMSPLVNAKTQIPYYGSGPFMIKHELGHACSRIKRDLMVKQGLKEALGEFMTTESCEVSSDMSATYKTASDKLGIHPDTFQCIEVGAKNATKPSFDGHPECKTACERAYLEESFAYIIAMVEMNAPEAKYSMLPLACDLFRDSKHGMVANDLRCALRTPSLRKKIEDGLECKK